MALQHNLGYCSEGSQEEYERSRPKTARLPVEVVSDKERHSKAHAVIWGVKSVVLKDQVNGTSVTWGLLYRGNVCVFLETAKTLIDSSRSCLLSRYISFDKLGIIL